MKLKKYIIYWRNGIVHTEALYKEISYKHLKIILEEYFNIDGKLDKILFYF